MVVLLIDQAGDSLTEQVPGRIQSRGRSLGFGARGSSMTGPHTPPYRPGVYSQSDRALVASGGRQLLTHAARLPVSTQAG